MRCDMNTSNIETIPSKQQIISGLPYFLLAKDEHDYVFTAILKLKRIVDGTALTKAVNLASKRYPYLLVCPVRTLTGIHLEHSNELIAVIETADWVPLDSEKSRHYLIVVTYIEKTIRIEYFRGLCTGKGIYPFVKTVLYYYFTILHKEEQKIENVRLTDTPMDSKEYFDPYSEKLPPYEKKEVNLPKSIKAMKLLKLGLVKQSEMQVRRIRIHKSEFERYLTSVGGSEKSFIFLTMFKALNSIHFSETEPIVGSLCGDMSRILRAATSIIYPSFFLNIVYDNELKEEEAIEAQHRIIRQRMTVLNDYDMICPSLLSKQAIYKHINQIPLLAIGQSVMKSWVRKCNLGVTFYVNFEWEFDFGTCDQYIEDFIIEPNIGGDDIFVDVGLYKDNYIISLYQKWKENLYFDAFCREIEASGLKYEIRHKET